MIEKAFLPGYEHDIFVSYAHEDQLGAWTVSLHEDLRKALSLILFAKLKGRPVNVWIDQILRNNLPLTDQLQNSVRGSALLLIVMSPFYLSSEWCGKEVAWFAAAARSRIAPDRRICIVHVLPTDRTTWPPAFAQLTPYRFFARHPKANLELPLGHIGDEPDKAAYKAVLYNLAGQIREQIEDLLAEAEAHATLPSAPTPVVVPLRPGSRADPPSAPPRSVCLEVMGDSPDAANVTKAVRDILAASGVDIFSPADLGVPPRNPLQADRLLQKIVKAKAACDGLLLLRLDGAALVGDWVIDYFSEVRPMAPRVRADRAIPRPLVIDAVPATVGPAPEGVPALRFDSPDFADRLAGWIDRLPVAPGAAA